MKRIIFASLNEGKIKEVRDILGDVNIHILSLSDVDFNGDIEEHGKTFEENAKIKAAAIFNKYRLPTIADDSGLVVEQLNGEPGIFSARYAGEYATDEDNNKKLLENLKSLPEPHKAKFVCSAVYYFGGDFFSALGEVYGTIIKEPHGNFGFGYDPLFVPNGYSLTSAELEPKIKNKISHRFNAFDQLKKYFME
jgi:XTP/dITP diphosphohydrolase